MNYLMALLLTLQVLQVPAYAAEAVPLAEDPRVEQRLVVIAEELRCLVCQNETLASSRAGLAMDLRREIRTFIKAGKSDTQIKEFMVSRYGDFVLYRPPVKPITWALWFGPFLLLMGAVALLMHKVLRCSPRSAAASELDPAQRAKAQALLKDLERPLS